MKNKSLITLILVLIVCVALVMVLASCNPNNDNTNPDSGSGQQGGDATTHKHVFGEWELFYVPTETTVGSIVRRCECGAEETLSLPVINKDNYSSTIVRTATCEQTGIIKYTIRINDIEFSFDIEQPALGHNYGEPVYEWSEECNSCIATRVCACGHEDTYSATINSVIVPSTCCEEGSITYTARFDVDWAETQTTTVVLPKLGHDYAMPTYQWSDDYTTCTATRVCTRDSSHKQIATVQTTNVRVEPTCTSSGTIVYTAEFDETWATTQTNIVDLPQVGHDYLPTEYFWENNYTTCVAKRVCSRDSNHTLECYGYVSSNRIEPTCTTAGSITYTATFSVDWAETRVFVVPLPASHDYGDASYEWNADYTQCTATRVCNVDSSHKDTTTATITSARVEPTCGGKGTITYTATFSKEWAAEQTAVVYVQPTGLHEYDATTHRCKVCGEYDPTYYTEGLVFTLSADGSEYSLTGYTGTDTDIVIPSIYNNKPMTTIAASAFDDNQSITSVVIADDVKNIGDYAFRGCRCLADIKLPRKLEQIGSAAFEDCASLTDITLVSSVTSIGENAFCRCRALTIYAEMTSKPASWNSNWNYTHCPTVWDCNNNNVADDNNIYIIYNGIRYALRNYIGYREAMVAKQPVNIKGDIVIPSSITYEDVTATVNHVVDNAFSSCSLLTSVYIPDSVKTMYSSVFEYCSALISVRLPDDITDISVRMFYGCASLTSVNIPTSTTTISYEAFYHCSKLTDIILPDGLTSIDSYAFEGCSSLTSIIMPSSVTEVGYYAFSSCSGITNLTLSDRWTDISYYTFSGCSSLTSIIIPDGVKSIGKSAFSGCSSLTSVTIPNSVTSIGDSAFAACSSLTNIAIPDSVTNIGPYAFAVCSALTSINIPSSVTSLSAGLLSSCSSLTNITIPSTVTSIGGTAFAYCTQLNNIVLPDSITSIYARTFEGCSALTSIIIPANVNMIDGKAFKDCTSLTSITIPEGVTSIEYNTFTGCSALTNITLPNSLLSIGLESFKGCTDLTDITLSNALTSIKENAFDGCTALQSITIPDSVTNIERGAFMGCSALEEVTMPANMTSICEYVFDGCNNIKVATIPTIVVHEIPKSSLTTVIINGGTVLESYSFFHSRSLKSITIADSVIKIGTEAFSGCTELTNITIPKSVKFIGDASFLDCTSLANIKIPSSVTDIGYRAFYGCTSLANITIPSSVISIGKEAFLGCSALDSVNITDISAWCNITFGDHTGNPLHCAHNLYINGELATSLDIPADITTIKKYAFNNCTSLTSVMIPSSVKNIEERAFEGCKGLVNITLSDGLINIDLFAFGECKAITSVVIPNSVTTIERSFLGCNALILYTELETKPVDWIIQQPVVLNYKNNSHADDGSIYVINNGIRYAIKNGEATVVSQSTTIAGNIFIPSSITYDNVVYDVTSITPFADCNLITGIVVDENNTVYTSRDNNGNECNCIIEKHSKKLVAGCKNTTIPNDVITIDISAFEGCTGLTSITIPDGVCDIYSYAFKGCTGLSSFAMPDSVTYIGREVFANCTSLTSVTLSNNIDRITEGAFMGCRSLANILIPSGVLSIVNEAFKECISLESVIFADNSQLNSIGLCAFDGCVSLKSITIPSGVKEIVGNAFSHCTSLSSVIFMENSQLTTISGQAFYYCTSLTDIIIPESTTTIFWSAFDGCTSLTIYAKTMSKPTGWNDGWNDTSPVYWYSATEPTGTPATGNGYWHYDTDGVTPVVWGSKAV